ncbi:hypothetical protein Tco_0288168 [Tanacetum coccineum]
MSGLLLSTRSCSKVLPVSEESLYGLNKIFLNPFSIVDVRAMSDTPKNLKHRVSWPRALADIADTFLSIHGYPKVLTYSITLSLEGEATKGLLSLDGVILRASRRISLYSQNRRGCRESPEEIGVF